MPIKINGLNTGSVTLSASATGGDVTLNLPNANGTVATTSYADSVPGLQYITGQSFSAISSVSVNNCFTSTYAYYSVQADISGSTLLDLDLRFRVGGVDTVGTSYFWDRHKARNTTAVMDQGASTDRIRTMPLTTVRSGLNLNIWNPQTATTSTVAGQCYGADATNYSSVTFAGFLNNSTQYDGFSLISSTGTITGNIRVYGYRNS